MNWKINFLLTAALTALTSSQLYIDGYLRNASYNIPNVFQRRENEQRLLKSQLIMSTRTENNVKSQTRDDFYKGGQLLENHDFIPMVSKEYCMEHILIENVTNYPTDYVNNKLIYENIFNIFYQSPEHPEKISEKAARRSLLTRRLCKFVTNTLAPFAAYVQEDDKCYFVVNRKNEPLQGVKYESCKSEGHQCSIYGIPTLYEQNKRYRQEYNTSCDQTYIGRSLIVLDYNGNLVQKRVKVKAACLCTKTKA